MTAEVVPDDGGGSVSNDEEYKKELSLLFENLRSDARNNMEYFKNCSGPNNERFYNAFYHLNDHLQTRIEKGVDAIMDFARCYDIDEHTRANGYRSLIKLVHKCAIHIQTLCKHISLRRGTFLFRMVHYSNELEAFVSTLGQLGACTYYAQQIVKFGSPGDLFASEAYSDDPIAEALMAESEAIDQIPFYGRCLAFQFCESMRKPFTVIHIAMASFSENYEHGSSFMKLAGSLLDSGKYLMDPDLRAQQIVNTTRNADINFCKSFWGLTETHTLQQFPIYMCPAVEVNEVIRIKPNAFTVPRLSGVGRVTIHPPTAHTGPGPVYVRLISHRLRAGQVTSNTKVAGPFLEKSANLLIHCHGGGFVAQSSKAHEVYLRNWAVDLQIPILSIDYSLAPESPYPRALEEIFFAYSWALENCDILGSTGARICVTGDSAGGNLMTAVTLKAITKGIRAPDGVVAMYTPFLIRYIPSPSRMLSLVDPLLPVGITARCLAAYAGIPEEELFEVVTSPTPSLKDEDSSDGEDYKPRMKKHVGLNIILDQLENEDEYDRQAYVPAKCSSINGVENVIRTNGNILCPGLKQYTKTRDMPCDTGQHCGNVIVKATCDTTQNSENDSKDLKKYAQRNIQEYAKEDNESLSLNSTQCPSTPEKSSRPTDIALGTSPPYYAQIRHFAQSPTPFRKFRHIHVARDPFLSPLLAPEDMLIHFPSIHLIVSHLDPLLDDSLTFAKRLRAIKREVFLHLVDDLPHGFLNFALVSRECKVASDLCITSIQQVFSARPS